MAINDCGEVAGHFAFLLPLLNDRDALDNGHWSRVIIAPIILGLMLVVR